MKQSWGTTVTVEFVLAVVATTIVLSIAELGSLNALAHSGVALHRSVTWALIAVSLVLRIPTIVVLVAHQTLINALAHRPVALYTVHTTACITVHLIFPVAAMVHAVT